MGCCLGTSPAIVAVAPDGGPKTWTIGVPTVTHVGSVPDARCGARLDGGRSLPWRTVRRNASSQAQGGLRGRLAWTTIPSCLAAGREGPSIKRLRNANGIRIGGLG